MKASVVWKEKINFPDNGDNCVYDLCFSPDGAQLIAACGLRILVVNVEDGTIIQALKGHKSTVFCVGYSSDGKRFASGGADKNVIIWTNTLQGTLKYVHGESIQCLAFNPQSQLLASCSVNDFGYWTPDKKSVDKHKVPAKICSCSWSSDGILLALGLANGIVTLRTKTGTEQVRIERPGGTSSAIWGVAFGRNPEDPDTEMICIADWGQTLSFYNLKGKSILKERSLGFDPLKLIYAKTGRDSEYIMVVGQNKAVSIFTTEGIRACTIADQESWVWTVAVKPNSFSLGIGTQGGSLTFYEVQMLVVHALYKSLYAYRINMTDVTVQNLLKDTRVRIKCRDVIKKLAIFKDALAIQFQDRVLIYQKGIGSEDLKYTLRDKINQSFECSLLVMCSENLILCSDSTLQSYTFCGVKVREWTLDSMIRYIRSVGGMSGKEVLVAGLKDGQVVKIFLDNPFPCPVVSVRSGVRCVDLNLLHTKIGVVDENSTLFVFDLESKPPELAYEELNAVSVFWNTYIEDLISFSGAGGLLNIKANGFPVQRQKMDGVVVGFCGSKVFSMVNSTVTTIEIPLSAPMYQYLQSKMYKEAYRVASLGIPTKDWDALANSALEGLDFEIARKAFAKTKDIKFLRLLDNFGKSHEGRVEVKAKLIFLADVYAHQGKFHEAAKLYKENGEEHKAMEMYADLRMFDQAAEYMGGDSTDKTKLLNMKAEWALKINEPRAAAEMFLAAGEKLRAIEIMGSNGWKDMLFDISRKLDRNDGDSLNACARNLERVGEVSAAAEMYRRIGRLDKVIELYVIGKMWQEAFIIAEKHPEFKKLAYLPYAQWLAENDQFAESQKAFHEAGCPEEAFRVLDQLRENAVLETRFHDAGYFHWVLSMQYLDLARRSSSEGDRSRHLDMFREHQGKANLYYAYNPIYRYLDQPFTPFMTDALFNISRFLLQEIYDKRVTSISKMKVAFTLAKQAKKLKAYKVVRFALEALKSVRVPEDLREGLDTFILESNGDPYHDAEEILPHCFRCSTTSFNPRGNFCINCHHPFVFSFINFDILPLVEFQLADGISDEEALGMIGSKLPSEAEVKAKRARHEERGNDGYWRSTDDDEIQVLQFEEDEESSMSNDPFSNKTIAIKDGGLGFAPIILDRAQLRALEPTEITVCKWPQPLRYKFYKNLLPDQSISQCHACYKLFFNDDFMLQVLQKNHCPFCRTPPRSALKSTRNPTEFLLEE